MEVKYWIYLIIGAVYLINWVRKMSDKKPEAPKNFQPEKPAQKFELPPAKPSASSRQLTFEELLKEITESKPSTQKSQPYQEVVDYDDGIGEEEQDLEEVDYDYRKKDKIYGEYEEAKRQAFVRPSLEETMKVEDTVMTFGKFKEFEQESRRDLVAEYLADFKDPEGMRKAVVMSEILQRKF